MLDHTAQETANFESFALTRIRKIEAAQVKYEHDMEKAEAVREKEETFWGGVDGWKWMLDKSTPRLADEGLFRANMQRLCGGVPAELEPVIVQHFRPEAEVITHRQVSQLMSAIYRRKPANGSSGDHSPF